MCGIERSNVQLGRSDAVLVVTRGVCGLALCMCVCAGHLYRKHLIKVPLFEGLEPFFLSSLAARMRIVTFTPRETIFRYVRFDVRFHDYNESLVTGASVQRCRPAPVRLGHRGDESCCAYVCVCVCHTGLVT